MPRAPAAVQWPLRCQEITVMHASGSFEVKMTPQAADENVGDASIGRMALDKRYHGDLDATGLGQMLAAGTAVQGSAGYVAMERVSGTLGGRRGAFHLQHSGTMTRGAPELRISVVPDSATDELEGLTGTLAIRIADGKHFYDFEYSLPDAG
jgi:hypothetical protein